MVFEDVSPICVESLTISKHPEGVENEEQSGRNCFLQCIPKRVGWVEYVLEHGAFIECVESGDSERTKGEAPPFTKAQKHKK
jgi:hypothetical protein